MARSRFFDRLQNYSFWLFDASGISGNPLFSVFDPVLAFSAITAPEITLELKEVKAGNWEYKRRVVKSADASSINLQRGAQFFDSDFFLWLTNALRGVQPVRRNLVLVQFLGHNLVTLNDTTRPGEIEYEGAHPAAAVIAQKIPGRAWMLHGSLPTRYKSGGDFDANSGEVSVQELEVQPEYVEELTVATFSPIAARAFTLGLSIAEVAGADLVT